MDFRSVGLRNPDHLRHAFCFFPEPPTCSFPLSPSSLILFLFPDLYIYHSAPVPTDPDLGAGEHLGERRHAHVCYVGFHVPGPAHAAGPPARAGKGGADSFLDPDSRPACRLLQIQNVAERGGLAPALPHAEEHSRPPLPSPAVGGKAATLAGPRMWL